MGLEEHLLTMFREDFEFSDAAGPSHLGHASAPAAHAAPAAEQAESEVATITAPAAAPAEEGGWTSEALAELGKIPFFVRGKARRNTERYASEHGVTTITRDTLYEAKSHYAR
jgi:light-independent protochlorophyllide reductase subunit B